MTTKTAQFTPGPLHLNGTYLPTGDGIGDGNNAYIRTADGRQLAQMYRKHPQAQAYAPMLAAAPAMYAIIKDMREAFYVKGTRKALLAVMERSRDVIAQAEGRQA